LRLAHSPAQEYRVPQSSVESITLSDAGQRYLASLQPAERQKHTPEVNRFVRWYGADRQLSDLRGVDIERYATENASAMESERRLTSLRALLAYAKKTSMTTENLATHVRVRRTGGGSGASEAINADRVEVTAEGRASLQRELEAFRAQRPKIAEALRMAMADKDFRENAPLDAAREQQAHLEARIRELESMLKRAVIVEGGAAGSTARMGSRVRLRDLHSDREVSYVLVGPGEVNASEGKISIASPVGKALEGRVQGEEVDVVAPSKTFRYRIEAIDV
jgi:transcription elongation factor GreA